MTQVSLINYHYLKKITSMSHTGGGDHHTPRHDNKCTTNKHNNLVKRTENKIHIGIFFIFKKSQNCFTLKPSHVGKARQL